MMTTPKIGDDDDDTKDYYSDGAIRHDKGSSAVNEGMLR